MLLFGHEANMATKMKRTTIYLTEHQHETLRQLAFNKRTSMARLIRDAALEVAEDEEDIREGLKSLNSTEGTVTWAMYKKNRRERERKGEL
jgi:hypothetical protein